MLPVCFLLPAVRFFLGLSFFFFFFFPPLLFFSLSCTLFSFSVSPHPLLKRAHRGSKKFYVLLTHHSSFFLPPSFFLALADCACLCAEPFFFFFLLLLSSTLFELRCCCLLDSERQFLSCWWINWQRAKNAVEEQISVRRILRPIDETLASAKVRAQYRYSICLAVYIRDWWCQISFPSHYADD